MLKLLGIPFDQNSSFMTGPSVGPSKVREMESNGSANNYAENGIAIQKGEDYFDIGNIKFSGSNAKEAYAAILKRVRSEINSKDRLISIGGDHSISFPLIEGHTDLYPQLNVLHLDAHADLYEDFESNYYSHASPFARLLEKGKLNSLTQVGIRTLNTHQQEQADRYGVDIIEMKEFNLDFLDRLQAPLYISLDIDVLDPAFAPGISHHEPGGMSTRQLIEIIQKINVPVIGADIVELNPKRDLNNMTAMVAYKLFKEIAAKMMEV